MSAQDLEDAERIDTVRHMTRDARSVLGVLVFLADYPLSLGGIEKRLSVAADDDLIVALAELIVHDFVEWTFNARGEPRFEASTEGVQAAYATHAAVIEGKIDVAAKAPKH